MKSQADRLIEHYQLQGHPEGGYFKRIYCSPFQYNNNQKAMSSILYLVEESSPCAVWHINKSDIVMYHLRGGSLAYDVIDQQGNHQRYVLGQHFEKGQTHQLIVKRGCYKATSLLNGQYGFLAEAVTPQFKPQDLIMFTQQQMCAKFPHLSDVIQRKELKRIKQQKQTQQVEQKKINEQN